MGGLVTPSDTAPCFSLDPTLLDNQSKYMENIEYGVGWVWVRGGKETLAPFISAFGNWHLI